MVGYLSGLMLVHVTMFGWWLVVSHMFPGSCVAVMVSILVNVSSHLSLFV